MGPFIKIINWLMANGAAVFGILQAAIKMVKEILTAVFDFLSLVLPSSVAQSIILTIRRNINVVDELVEKAKQQLLEFLN